MRRGQRINGAESRKNRMISWGMAALLMLGGGICMSACGSQETGETATDEKQEDMAKSDEQMEEGSQESWKKEKGILFLTLPEEKEEHVVLPVGVSGKLVGKRLSIVGDSVSTFDDWIPEGYYDFYPMNGEGVDSVEQTWWKMVLNNLGMELCVNASSAGSTCVGNSLGTDDPQSGCNEFRMGHLLGENGEYPDMIIVYMGNNDFLKAIPLGENDGTVFVDEGEIETFSDGYSLILEKLMYYYPGSDIFCCTLLPIGTWGKETPFEMMVNGLDLTSEDYNEKIVEIATAKECVIIDLQHCGITIDNMQQYMSDGLHLKPEGMVLIRDAVKAAISGFYQDS